MRSWLSAILILLGLSSLSPWIPSQATAWNRDDFASKSFEQLLDEDPQVQNAAHATIGKIERTNRHLKASLSQQAPASSVGTCEECSQRAEKILRYDQCTAKNDYLERTLQNLKIKKGILGDLMNEGLQKNSLIKPSCIEAGLETRFSSNSRSFVSCENGRQTPKASEPRPCLSENYITLVSNSLDLVGRCLLPTLGQSAAEQKEALREVYGLFAVESGLHINATSPRGAAGSGQFVGATIDQLNKGTIAEIRQNLISQGGHCAQMGRELLGGDEPMSGEHRLRCERTSLEKGNPLLNMIYTFALIADHKSAVDHSLFQERHYRRFFSNLSETERNRLAVSLAVWAHNAGFGGINTPVHALLNSTYRGRKVTNVDHFLKSLSASMRAYPNSANRSASRRSETSQYEPRIHQTLNKLEIAGGGSCVQ